MIKNNTEERLSGWVIVKIGGESWEMKEVECLKLSNITYHMWRPSIAVHTHNSLSICSYPVYSCCQHEYQ